MNLTEDQIGNWARAPSETEDAKCLNAISQATDALRGRFGDSVRLVRQGSHTNRTNVCVDSDVDMAVVHTGFFFAGTSSMSPADKALYQANRTPASYSYAQYKSDVDAALRTAFGQSMVERKNKCIRVSENTNRAPIDIAPTFEHHRFSSYGVVSVKGIGFQTDSGETVYSFPEQHYDNGVTKNANTSRSFKAMVRILKRTRNRLIELKTIGVDAMPSFFIECLVWNVPNEVFNKNTWKVVAGDVTAKIWNDMRDPAVANNYAEVSDLRWLFRGNSKRTYAQAEDFMLHAWRYLTQ